MNALVRALPRPRPVINRKFGLSLSRCALRPYGLSPEYTDFVARRESRRGV
jgi:hypothetical protein